MGIQMHFLKKWMITINGHHLSLLVHAIANMLLKNTHKKKITLP